MQSLQGDPRFSDAVPAGQLKHLSPPRLEVVPKAQASHELAPASEVVPG
jgi:hypothetical protein